MESLARGGKTSVFGVDGPQEIGIHTAGQTFEFAAGMVFSHFHFTVSYWPGSKNGKPDALFQLGGAEWPSKEPKSIIFPNQILASVTGHFASR